MHALLLVPVGVAALLILGAAGLHNRITSLRHRVANARHQIEVQLRRRHDLIPNLVEVAEAAMRHERQTLEALVRARQAAVAALPAGAGSKSSTEAEALLSSALIPVTIFIEAHPELKALASMRALQEELGSTENRIAFARQHYNDAATAFNLARDQFPGSLFARAAPPAPLWEMPELGAPRAAGA
jgi:LemA protein